MVSGFRSMIMHDTMTINSRQFGPWHDQSAGDPSPSIGISRHGSSGKYAEPEAKQT